MKPRMERSHFSKWPMKAGLVACIPLMLVTSCVTPYQDQRTRQEVGQREDMLIIQEEMRRLAGRIETLELEMEQVYREVDTQKTEMQRSQRAQRDQMQQNLGTLEQRVDSVEAARARDREEIIEQLSATMSRLIREHAASTAASRPAASGYGYEHVVGPGETLSHIAAAYGVTTRTIIDANNISNPDRLQVGQRLFIPD